MHRSSPFILRFLSCASHVASIHYPLSGLFPLSSPFMIHYLVCFRSPLHLLSVIWCLSPALSVLLCCCMLAQLFCLRNPTCIPSLFHSCFHLHLLLHCPPPFIVLNPRYHFQFHFHFNCHFLFHCMNLSTVLVLHILYFLVVSPLASTSSSSSSTNSSSSSTSLLFIHGASSPFPVAPHLLSVV